MKEKWKKIPGYEGLYSVSNLGQVKSLKRKVPNRYGFRTVNERIIKPFIDDDGYSFVSLWKNNKGKTYQIHQLVMRSFIGPVEEGTEIIHLTSVQQGGTNELSNLRYGSRLCNSAFKIDDGTDNRGEKCGTSKLTENDVHKIRKLLKTNTQKEIASMYNVTPSTISLIKRNLRWCHI